MQGILGRRGGRLVMLALVVLGAAVVFTVRAGAAHSATATQTVTVAAAQPVYLTHAGQTAQVSITVTTSDGAPLAAPANVSYMAGSTITLGSGKTLPSTAVAGTDYTPASGTLTFPAGTASGSSQTITVTTLPSSAPSVAKTINIALSSTSGGVTVNSPPTVVINAHGLPYLDSSLPIATRVKDLLSRMSTEEKIGEMTQADRSMFLNPDPSSGNSPDELRAWYVGSLLSGGGDTPTPNNAQGWADMVDSFEYQALATPLQIPLIYGEDTVHGDGNMIGVTVFPHNIGMGATRDPMLTQLEGQITAEETRASGPQWGFAPCVCVARDIRWGRTYESFGEDPALVQRMETEITGFQGDNPQASLSTQSSLAAPDHILSTAKHYAGDGGTTYGTGDSGYPIDQGITQKPYSTFYRLFVTPYVTAVRQQKVGSIMPSYSSVQFSAKECPVKMSADKFLLTNVLKNQIGFKGFLISDYNAVNEIGDSRSCPIPNPLPAGIPDTYSYQIAVSADAGMDMFMVPSSYQTLETDLLTLVRNGVVPMSRVDDAVSRILTQKFELGLFEHPFTNRSGQSQIGDAAHRAVAARAVAESQVLLKNTGHLLPLSTNEKIYVAGSNADNLGAQTGGWTLTWQGQPGKLPDPGTTILGAISGRDHNVTFSADASAPTSGYDVGVVVVGEHPYAEGQGDVGFNAYPSNNGNISSLDLSAADRAAVNTVCHAMKCVVLIVSGRPMTIHSQLGEIDALVASWLPGTEGEGVTQVLFGNTPFHGQLPQSWPRSLSQEPINVGDPTYDPQFPFGWGLHDTTVRADAMTARDALSGSARDALTRLLNDSGAWSNGSPTHPAAVLAVLKQVAGMLHGSGQSQFAQQELVVAVARDIAQAAIVAAGGPTQATSTPFAQADHVLLEGHPAQAVALLAQATQLAG